MLYLGIDPGKKGGVAYICSISGQYGAFPMPPTPRQAWQLLHDLQNNYGHLVCTIEQVQVMGKTFGAKAALSYGQGYGVLLGLLTALSAQIVEVRPSAWKKGMKVSADKQSSILLTEKLFPELDLKPGRCTTCQDGLAEAMLLAEYGRRSYGK